MLFIRFLCAASLFFSCSAALAQELIQVPCAIQLASTASDGKHTIPEIIQAARSKGIRAVILTDRDLMQWEYGVWPLQNILKKTVRQRSLFSYGLTRYFSELEKIKKENQDLIIIAGVESAPFYYWQGSVFTDDLTLKDWHKHMLAVGLKDSRDYALLPVIGNKRALALKFGFRNLYLFWPVLLLGAGAVLYGARHRRPGLIAAALGAVLLINNFPFQYYRFDQYHGDRNAMPFQQYIDYVRSRNGLTFWVHPEACNQCQIGNVRIDTEKYLHELYRTQDYTGFSILYEGDKQLGVLGGLWDRLLQYYCQSKRKAPVWAIGTLGFDETGDLKACLDDLRTVVLAERFDEDAVLDALRSGRAYVVSGKNSADFFLDDFSVRDRESNASKTMGQTLLTHAKPLVKIRAHLLRGQSGVFTIQLIKDGKIVKQFEEPAPFELNFQDAEVSAKKSYYRLVIKGNGVELFTNPVFVRQDSP